MEVLFEREVSAEKFAEEMERFFMYHSLRKQKVINNLHDELKTQSQIKQKLITTHIEALPKEYKAS